jgi:tRNA pseudouridine38-40 synthase
MPRYKLIVEYDGTPFSGWQRQDEFTTVQGCIEDAIFKFCQERVTVSASGRTDAGVHARAQVAHFDSPKELDLLKIIGALNFHLQPHPIVIHNAEQTPDDWHSRFSARERSYQYRIINRRAPLAIELNRAWQVIDHLEADKMNEAAKTLIGTFDFTTFRDSACQAKSPIRSISHISVRREGDEVLLDIAAPSFLHHMVRNIIGSLLWVGTGKWTVADFIAARDAKDRTKGGMTAPSCGLYFMNVKY